MRTQTIGNYGGVGLVISKDKDDKGKDSPYIKVVNAFEGYAFDAGGHSQKTASYETYCMN
jgi:C-terminal processing protease CtpA/Prc